MNSFQLLLNNKFTGGTTIENSSLSLEGGYFVYTNSNGGGIVNSFNVRGFLNDTRNKQVINDFFSFLTGNTTNDEALNIINSDQKLANVFNGYYQSFVISASSPSNTSVIQQNLTGTTLESFTSYPHPWFGDSKHQQLTGITESITNSITDIKKENIVSEFTTEESYFLPINLHRNTNQIPRMVYETCDIFITDKTKKFFPQYSAITSQYLPIPSPNSGTTTSLIDCFVDLNLNVTESAGSASELLTVSFENFSVSAAEGDTLQVKVSLNKPSVFGYEEISIILFLFGTDVSDFTPVEQYPLTLYWANGEQDKFLTFNINNDYIEEVTEPFYLQIAGLINVNTGAFPTTIVYIEDRTNLNYVSLENGGFPIDSSGVLRMTAVEDSDVDFLVKLDNPAFGVEKVVLNKVSILNTIVGQVGPATIELQPSEYIMTYQSAPGAIPTQVTTPFTITFSPGEMIKGFLISIKNNNALESEKIAYFELDAAQFCVINQYKKMTELIVSDNDGKYQYIHINLGTIYNEFGNSQTNTYMRQLNGGSSNNTYVSYYANYLIEYGATISFKDYSLNAQQSVKFVPQYIKLKITNTGTVQSKVNGITVNVGSFTTIVVPSNNYILNLSTNFNLNSITNFYEKGNYKIELIDTYNASLVSGLNISGFNPFILRSTDNLSVAASNTILIGNISLQGYNVLTTDTSKAYKIKSTYRDVNTGRIFGTGSGGQPTISCSTVATPSQIVTFSEFYQNTIENISIFGIMLLNHNQETIYSESNSSQSKYNGFYFLDYQQPFNLTCNKTASYYNGLGYFNLPFIVETDTFVGLYFNGSFDKMYNFQLKNKGEVPVKFTNTLNGPVKLASTGQIINIGQSAILQVDDIISIPNQADEPSFPGPGVNSTVTGKNLLLPGNSTYDPITHKYTQAKYHFRPIVSPPYSASHSFNTVGQNIGASTFFDNVFTWAALESGYQKYKFVSQGDANNILSNGIHSMGNTGGNEDLMDVMLQSF